MDTDRHHSNRLHPVVCEVCDHRNTLQIDTEEIVAASGGVGEEEDRGIRRVVEGIRTEVVDTGVDVVPQEEGLPYRVSFVL